MSTKRGSILISYPFRYVERPDGAVCWQVSKTLDPSEYQGIQLICDGYLYPQWYPDTVVITPPVLPYEDEETVS